MVLLNQGQRPRNPKIHTIEHVSNIFGQNHSSSPRAFSHLETRRDIQRGGTSTRRFKNLDGPRSFPAYVTAQHESRETFFFKSISAPRKAHARPRFPLVVLIETSDR